MRHLAVLPLGVNSITKDITSLQILENVAEKLKIHYGNANPDNEDNEDNFLTPDKKNGIDSPEIMIGTLNNVIQCRYEEIIENILNQVKLSGYEKQLASGYILTGGASNMKGLKELFKKKTDAEVKQGYFQRQIACRNVPELGRETAFATLLGLMVRGTINCKKKEVIVEPVIVEPVKTEPTPTEKQQPNEIGRGSWRERVADLV